jgi:hypothetical protein
LEDVGIFYGHLVHFTVFCYILWKFGIVPLNLVHFFPFWYFVPKKSGNPDTSAVRCYNESSRLIVLSNYILPSLETTICMYVHPQCCSCKYGPSFNWLLMYIGFTMLGFLPRQSAIVSHNFPIPKSVHNHARACIQNCCKNYRYVHK